MKLSLKHASAGMALALVAGLAVGWAGAQPDPEPDRFSIEKPCGPCKFTVAPLSQTPDLLFVSADPPAAAPELVLPDPNIPDLVAEAKKVQMTWREFGALFGVIGLVGLLVKVTKLSVVGELFARNKIQWIRPLLAIVLSGLMASAAAVGLGANLPWVISAGVIAAVAAPGAHEVYESIVAMFSKEKRGKLQDKALA